MNWLALPLIVVVLAALGLRSRRRGSSPSAEEAARAAIELYRIRRNMDVAWAKTEIRREATRLRRLMEEELDGSSRR